MRWSKTGRPKKNIVIIFCLKKEIYEFCHDLICIAHTQSHGRTLIIEEDSNMIKNSGDQGLCHSSNMKEYWRKNGILFAGCTWLFCLHPFGQHPSLLCLGLLQHTQHWHLHRLYIWRCDMWLGGKLFFKLMILNNEFIYCNPFWHFQTCSEPGICIGVEIGNGITETEEDCIILCGSTAECNWYSYDYNGGLCILTSTCDSIQECGTDQCVHGEKECGAGERKVPYEWN